MTEVQTLRQATDSDRPTGESPATEEEVLTSEMLVEEVSIDGMCGVY